MKIRSAIPENGCLIFMHFVVADDDDDKKTDCKTYTQCCYKYHR